MSKKLIIPRHIGIILDGNRRWARKRGLPTFFGHKRGADRLKEIVEYAQDIGIKILTTYVFSTENWGRSKKEVDYLMKLLVDFVEKFCPEKRRGGVQ